MKRLSDASKWTGWFRKLESKHKLFWLYVLDTCDPVGVWDEDIELAGMILKEELDPEEINKIFGDKIKKFKPGKWWIIDFVSFQYGPLIEENIKNKPHQSYIKLLKKHSLWKDYLYTIDSDKEKEKDKETVKEEEKEKEEKKEKCAKKETIELVYPFEDKSFRNSWDVWKKYKKEQHNFTYKGEISEQAALKEVGELANGSLSLALKLIQNAISNGWKGIFEIKQSGKKSSGYSDDELLDAVHKQNANPEQRSRSQPNA